jgi:putative oxidoreductase
VARAHDLASLVLRGVLGSTMIVHGVRHAKTIDGTARWFASIGFAEPELQARLSAVTEVGSGAALLLGAATPAASSAVIGTMAVAARTVHADNGYFITKEGYEYVLALSGAATALAALGPGRWSVDAALGLEHRLSGFRGALGALGLGIASAAAILAKYWTKPVPKEY